MTGIMRCVDRQSKVVQREDELRNGRNIGLVRTFEEGKLAQEYRVNEKGNRDGVFC